MKVNFNKKKLYTDLLAFIGFFYICYFVWFRFILEIMPKDIPFNLTLINFIVIFMIIISLAYIIFNLIFDYDLYKYTCVEMNYARETYAKQHNIVLPFTFREYKPNYDFLSISLNQQFHFIMPKIIYFKAFLKIYNDITKKNIIKWNIFILTGYLLCWISILIVSIHTLNLQEALTFMQYFKDNIKPFSELHLKY